MRRGHGDVWVGLAIAAAAVFATVHSCGDTTSSDPLGGETPEQAKMRRQVLASVADNIIVPTYTELAASAAALEDATATWAESGEATDREAAQTAWKATMDIVQRAEMFQVGPAALRGDNVGGMDLRDEVYSWPLVNPCRVDQETATGSFRDRQALAALPPNVRGLDALEYLLFVEGGDNSCSANSELNMSGTWSALGDESAIRSLRAEYAAAVAAELRERADELLAAWQPDAGDFRTSLAMAGAAGSAYPTAQAALNELSNALFYLDREVKDTKLAGPGGLSDACAQDTCPELVESTHARRSREHVLANLRGFRLVFTGSEDAAGFGFDDLLADLGAEDLAEQMLERIDAAIASVEAIPGSLTDALTSDPAKVVAAHAAIKEVTDLLKTQFVSILDLELPSRVEGDND